VRWEGVQEVGQKVVLLGQEVPTGIAHVQVLLQLRQAADWSAQLEVPAVP
jgi:hypothetical protein